MSETSEYPAVDVLYAEALRVMLVQSDQSKQIEGKASLVVAFAGVVATNLPAIGFPPLLFLGVVTTILTFAFGGAVLWPSDYAAGPRLKDLRADHICDSAETTKLVVVDTVIEQVDENRRILNSMANLLAVELLCFVLTVGAIVAGKLLTTTIPAG